MHKQMIMIVLALASLCAPHFASATETGEMPVVAFSSKFRHVDYLFTEHAEKAALEDGASYEIALREVGWELISAVGRACSSVNNIEGIFIDRIHFKTSHSLVALGVLSDLKFLSFAENASANPALKALFEAFDREHITMTRLADTNAVELSMTK